MALAESPNYNEQIDVLAHMIEDFATLLSTKCGYGKVMPGLLFLPQGDRDFKDHLSAMRSGDLDAYKDGDRIYIALPSIEQCKPPLMADTIRHLKHLGASEVSYHFDTDRRGKSFVLIDITNLIYDSKPLDMLLNPPPETPRKLSRRAFLDLGLKTAKAAGALAIPVGGLVAIDGAKDICENALTDENQSPEELERRKWAFSGGMVKFGLGTAGGIAGTTTYLQTPDELAPDAAEAEAAMQRAKRECHRYLDVNFIETAAQQLRDPCFSFWIEQQRSHAKA